MLNLLQLLLPNSVISMCHLRLLLWNTFVAFDRFVLSISEGNMKNLTYIHIFKCKLTQNNQEHISLDIST